MHTNIVLIGTGSDITRRLLTWKWLEYQVKKQSAKVLWLPVQKYYERFEYLARLNCHGEPGTWCRVSYWYQLQSTVPPSLSLMYNMDLSRHGQSCHTAQLTTRCGLMALQIYTWKPLRCANIELRGINGGGFITKRRFDFDGSPTDQSNPRVMDEDTA